MVCWFFLLLSYCSRMLKQVWKNVDFHWNFAKDVSRWVSVVGRFLYYNQKFPECVHIQVKFRHEQSIYLVEVRLKVPYQSAMCHHNIRYNRQRQGVHCIYYNILMSKILKFWDFLVIFYLTFILLKGAVIHAGLNHRLYTWLDKNANFIQNIAE